MLKVTQQAKETGFTSSTPAPQRATLVFIFFSSFPSLECLPFKAISKDLGAVQTQIKCRAHRLPLRKVVVTLPRERRQSQATLVGVPGGRGCHRWRAPLILAGSEGKKHHWLLSPKTMGSHSPLSLSPEADTKCHTEGTVHTPGEP